MSVEHEFERAKAGLAEYFSVPPIEVESDGTVRKIVRNVRIELLDGESGSLQVRLPGGGRLELRLEPASPWLDPFDPLAPLDLEVEERPGGGLLRVLSVRLSEEVAAVQNPPNEEL